MNNCVISGNLGKDAELRGGKVLAFTLANRVYAGKEAGERTVWFDCIVFGNRAQSLDGVLLKGMKVAVTGRFEDRDWMDKQNVKRKSWQLVVSDIEFLSNGKSNGRAAESVEEESFESEAENQDEGDVF